MNVMEFCQALNCDFYTGVPDSQLKALCDYLMQIYGIDKKHHIIAANEGNCLAIAAGYHLATGKIPVVYMQNSGEGNIINTLASLLNDNVYAITCIFIVGWRGEPGIHDEPQHIYQGKVTLQLLHDMDVETYVVDNQTTADDIAQQLLKWDVLLKKGKQVAFIIKKGSLINDEKHVYKNDFHLLREDAIRQIIKASGNDPVISTTGKASRELFEIRETNKQGHQFDFLTVGSMGHSSSIALGVAINKINTTIWCIDGDGAALMHMGAMALIGSIRPNNLIHIVINNGAHETVGGMPTVAGNIDMVNIAKACGYVHALSVSTSDELEVALTDAKMYHELTFIEVKCSLGSRSDLGRPTTTAKDNKEHFMNYLSNL